MGLNDEAEKLRQAGEWLKGDARSENFKAAFEHMTHVLNTSPDPALSAQAQKLEDAVLARFGVTVAFGESTRSDLIRHLHTHPDHAGRYPAGHDFVLVGTMDIWRQHERQHEDRSTGTVIC
jgi:2-oxo-4-hydroxy-4-carboxy--5-ureidoimidazoline (OHCU) decarboxylase